MPETGRAPLSQFCLLGGVLGHRRPSLALVYPDIPLPMEDHVFGIPATSGRKNRPKALLAVPTPQFRDSAYIPQHPAGPANSLLWTTRPQGQGASPLQAPGALGQSPTSHFPRLGWAWKGRGPWTGLRFGYFLSSFLLNRCAAECVGDTSSTGGFSN